MVAYASKRKYPPNWFLLNNCCLLHVVLFFLTTTYLFIQRETDEVREDARYRELLRILIAILLERGLQTWISISPGSSHCNLNIKLMPVLSYVWNVQSNKSTLCITKQIEQEREEFIISPGSLVYKHGVKSHSAVAYSEGGGRRWHCTLFLDPFNLLHLFLTILFL